MYYLISVNRAWGDHEANVLALFNTYIPRNDLLTDIYSMKDL